MNLDFGQEVNGRTHKRPTAERPAGIDRYIQEHRKFHPDTGEDVTGFDPQVMLALDRSKIEGNFQSEDYIIHRKQEITDWYQSTLQIEVPEDACVITFRGGEYKFHPNLMLSREYYTSAMRTALDINPKLKFMVVTDDPKLAREYFGDIQIYSHRRLRLPHQLRVHPSSRTIGHDFTRLQNAKYLILSNSSFSWWGAWTNSKTELVVAPKYWASHNRSDGYWSQGDALTRGWEWIDRAGERFTFEECRKELESYRLRNEDAF
jgi:hypothetical protein